MCEKYSQKLWFTIFINVFSSKGCEQYHTIITPARELMFRLRLF